MVSSRLLVAFTVLALFGVSCHGSGALANLPIATFEQARSCKAASGEWRCGRLQPPPPTMLGVTSNVIPTSWTVASWFIDASNASGCASDQNDCQHSSCSGSQGPCSTYGEITARWGTVSPILQQSTTITIQSSHTSQTDPIDFEPTIEKGVDVGIKGISYGTQQGTGTITSITSKNRNTPQPLNITTAVSIGTGELVLNSTAGPSVGWAAYNVTGTTWAMTQPLVQAAPPQHTLLGSLAENNSWAGTNTITTFIPFSANIAKIRPKFTDSGSTLFPQQLYVWRLNLVDPNTEFSAIDIGDGVEFYECETQPSGRIPNINASGKTLPNGGLVNVFLQAGANVTSVGGPAYVTTTGTTTDTVTTGSPGYPNTGAGSQQSIFGGGTVTSTALIQLNLASQQYGVQIDGDYMISSSGTANSPGLNTAGNVQLGFIDLDSNGGTAPILTIQTGVGRTTHGVYGNPIIWGQGTIDVNGNSQLQCRTGAAVFTFVNIGVFTINSNTAACSFTVATPSVINCGILLTPSNLAAAAGVAGFGNQAFNPGGGSIVCNSAF